MNRFERNNHYQPVLPRAGCRFPRHLPFSLLSAAVDEVENNIQAPRPLILSGALAAISLACQGLINVCKPNGQIVPASLMLLSIANSGERKTTAENIFLDPVREIQRLEYLKYQASHTEWGARMEAWKAKKSVILKRISKKSGNGIDSSGDEMLLIEHEKNKPAKPRQFKMIYDDATSEALFMGLHQSMPSAGLISSEGGGIINGAALNDLSKQNSLWSGDSITVDRASVESYDVSNARLTVSIMLQESTFKDYMDRRGEKSRGSGLWARFLVCHPQSTQGTRTISNCTMSWECCGKFTARMAEILKKNLALLDNPEKDKYIVKFSTEARERWLDAFNEIELGIRPEGRFNKIADHASKLADNIARVAALFHYFEVGEGEVSCETLDAAIDLCCWYSDQFYNIFVPPPQEDVDALELELWLQGYWNKGYRSIRKNKILQCGPSKLREKKRLDLALEALWDKGMIRFFRQGKTTYIDLI